MNDGDGHCYAEPISGHGKVDEKILYMRGRVVSILWKGSAWVR